MAENISVFLVECNGMLSPRDGQAELTWVSGYVSGYDMIHCSNYRLVSLHYFLFPYLDMVTSEM